MACGHIRRAYTVLANPTRAASQDTPARPPLALMLVRGESRDKWGGPLSAPPLGVPPPCFACVGLGREMMGLIFS